MRGLAGCVAVALAVATLAGCSASSQHQRTVTLASGLTATVPATAPTMTAKASSDQVHYGAALKQLAAAEDVTATGKLPASGMVLTFHVDPAQVPPGPQPFLADLDQNTGQWAPVASSYDPKTGAISAHVSHFGVWAPMSWVRTKIVAMLKGELLTIFASGGAGAHPRCATPVVRVTDSHPAGAGIGSCAEAAGAGEVRVKIGNTHPYLVDITYPSTQHNAQGTGGSSVTITSSSPFTKLWKDASAGKHALLPGSGEDDVGFPLSPGQSGQATTHLDGAAFRAALLEVAVRFAAQLGGKTKDLVDALDKAGCALHDIHLGAATALSKKSAEGLGPAAFGCVGSVLPESEPLLRAGVTVATSLVTGIISASWPVIDAAAGNAGHVFTVQVPAVSTPAKVYLRTAPTQGFQAGFRIYRPPCAAAEDCPLTLVPASGSTTANVMAMTGMQWPSWTSTQASGTGTFLVGTYTKSYPVPVHVTLSRPVQACGHYYWSAVQFTPQAGNQPPSGYQDLFNATLAIGNVHDQPCPK